MRKGLLIADAGSSKTHWSFIEEKTNDIVWLYTGGINPVNDSKDDILGNIRDAKKRLGNPTLSELYFYGAGCGSGNITSKISTILKNEFNVEKVEVGSDLIGAAKALFGDSEGIACILGTGSNSCIYKNGEIERKIPSLGYVLGDEGGGVALGKALLNGIFKKQFSLEIISEFQKKYALSEEELIRRVYKTPHAPAFIASFSPFLLEHITHPEIVWTIEQQFDNFFQKNILPYKESTSLPIGFVGSIAYNYSEILIKTAQKHKISIYKIISNPILELEKFYRKR